uniref:Uncharacterized protein n=1 Tax=Electrophorus electricus TaxID=8005 RepID=A0A4W4F878_ELEEL
TCDMNIPGSNPTCVPCVRKALNDRNTGKQQRKTTTKKAFGHMIEKGVCYLTLCETGFLKMLAFAFREDLEIELNRKYGGNAYNTYIQKTKKSYIDGRAPRNLGSINTELQDVQRIMVANIEEVLQRGKTLFALDSKYLNIHSTYAKVATSAIIFLTLVIYACIWWL